MPPAIEYCSPDRGDDELVFEVADHWYPGAVAAMHWLGIALVRAPEVLTEVLGKHGAAPGGPPELESWPPLVPVGDDLVVVSRSHDEVSCTEGIPYHPTPAEQEAVDRARRTGECACSLCRA